MKNIFFLSDVHLGLQDKQQERAKERLLLSFLSHVEKNGGQLFIVGDLFDYWFEYRHVIPRGYHHVLSKLAALVEKGIAVHYLAGNHDYWLKDFFPLELGIPVYHDPFGMTLHGKQFYFHHGDGLSLNDTSYIILKKILRSRISIFLYSLLHPDWTAPLARGSSKTSRRYTGNKDFGENDGMIKYAEEKLSNGYDIVIMGHRHTPIEHRTTTGIYINLGDWITHHSYAEFDGRKIKLKYWHDAVEPVTRATLSKKSNTTGRRLTKQKK